MSAARALSWMLLGCLACAPARPGLEPRNLLLVTVDGLRFDHLGCYGHARPASALPTDSQERLEDRAFALDELCASGVGFARAFAPSAGTLPSLATLLTGLPPVATGVLDERSRLPLDVPTLAELAHAGGFRCAAFVSQPRIDVLGALGRGFDESHAASSDAETLKAARSFLAGDFGSERRCFVWIHLSGLEPSWPAVAADEIARPEMDPARFRDPSYAGPADGSEAFFAALRARSAPLAPDDREALARLYDGRLALLGGRLAGFLQEAFDYNKRGMEATEFWSRTLFVLAGTHGFDLGEDGARTLAELRDGMLHVPLVLRHPDSLTGERVLAPVVELGDLLPTLVDLLELPRPRAMPGRSLLGLTDAHPQREFETRPAVTQTAERLISARDEHWRLVWNPYRGRLPEGDPRRALPLAALYDERTPAAPDVTADHPLEAARLQAEVKDWITHQTFRASLPLVPGRVHGTQER